MWFIDLIALLLNLGYICFTLNSQDSCELGLHFEYRYSLEKFKYKSPAENIAIKKNLSTLKICLFLKKKIPWNFNCYYSFYNLHLIEILITQN